jgi:uncharacterized membrane protein HdeD (DUF308 family)
VPAPAIPQGIANARNLDQRKCRDPGAIPEGFPATPLAGEPSSRGSDPGHARADIFRVDDTPQEVGQMEGSSWLIVRGVASFVIGILAFLWPGVTIAVLVGMFAAYAIVDGFTILIMGLSHTTAQGRSWAQVAQGVLGIAAGALTLVWPGATALALIFFIGAWAIVTGVFEIAAAIRLRRVIHGEWLLGLSGALSVLFGFVMFAFPGAGALAIAWMLGAYAAAAGIVLIALGIKLRAPDGRLVDA